MSGQPPVHTTAQVKTERLLNLVIALLSTRMPLSKARIKAAVPQYHGTASDEAFDRMFERDKDELRELGIPLVTSVIDPVFDDELGYRIDKREYALPEISFEPDEVAALSLAARTWTRASLAGPAATALRKLRAAGVTMDDASLVGIEPVVRTTEEAFEPLRRAVRDRRAVTFGYRKPDAESTRGTCSRGGWPSGTVAGTSPATTWTGAPPGLPGRPDRHRGDRERAGRRLRHPRSDHDAREMVDSTQDPTSPPRVATLGVREGSGNALRRRARVAADALGHRVNRSNGVAGDGWSTVEVDFRDVDRLADKVAGYGPEGWSVAPNDLTEAVVRRLSGVAGSRRARRGGAV